MTRYVLGDADRAVIDRAATVLKRVAAAGPASPAQLVTVGKVLHALSRMPQVSNVGDMSLSVISPRRQYGDIEVYFWWDIAFEENLVTIKSGGHFYRSSTGGDTFQSMVWQAYPGEPAELSDYHAHLAIVPGLRSFLTDIPTTEELSGFELSVEDENNELLEEEDEDEEDEADEDEGDAEQDDGYVNEASGRTTPVAPEAQESTEAAADLTAHRVVSSAVEWLQSQHSDLAGEDSGLGNLWLEFCAQVQGEQSADWDNFETVVREIVEAGVQKLSSAEREALWLQTEAGRDWLGEDSVEAAQVPVLLEDVVDDIYGRVWQRAADWEDQRLERYLAQSDDDEYCEDEEDEEDEEPDPEDEDVEEDADWAVSPQDEVEQALAATVDPAKVDARRPQFAYGVDQCGLCDVELDRCGFMVDGRLKGSLMWSNLCARCFAVYGEGLGDGAGQLYAKQRDGRWRLVAGFPS